MPKSTPNSKPSKGRVITPAILIDDSPPKRKGIHAKRGTARLKTSKNYKKPYRGQGRRR